MLEVRNGEDFAHGYKSQKLQHLSVEYPQQNDNNPEDQPKREHVLFPLMLKTQRFTFVTSDEIFVHFQASGLYPKVGVAFRRRHQQLNRCHQLTVYDLMVRLQGPARIYFVAVVTFRIAPFAGTDPAASWLLQICYVLFLVSGAIIRT
jgi:hypothetical protein